MYYEHEDFEGRAKYPGFDPVDDYYGEMQNGSDCHFHGTHVASLAAGRVYGAAKKATIYSVRVLGCFGGAPTSVVINGINYAAEKANETRRPSIISMSLGGGYSPSENLAIANAVNGDKDRGIPGVTVVVAAGNSYFRDACWYSPASAPEAITVGSSTRNNTLSDFTNVGSCVDIFAPGSNIEGASLECPTCNITVSGTSMATPIVSGGIAVMLGKHPWLTPSEVYDLLIHRSTKDALNFTHPYDYLGLLDSTPNRLLHIPSKLHYNIIVGISLSRGISFF